ncbi:MAG: hypothetical protein HFI38_00115 [Lachnospiraceae bacterium]|jgi:hypothetical protein|nr:hypothetical protein [Lachnospiraceae bacterium]
MKIGEAQKFYSSQLDDLYNRERGLLQLKKMADSGQGTVSQALLDELQAASKEREKLAAYMQDFMAYRNSMEESLSAKQQGEAGAKAAEDLVKCIEIARRIANGDHVPASDEEKLMNHSMEMYIAAKNAAMLSDNKDSKDYDSLWEEEEETDPRTASEIVDDTECTIAGPSSYDVSME